MNSPDEEQSKYLITGNLKKHLINTVFDKSR